MTTREPGAKGGEASLDDDVAELVSSIGAIVEHLQEVRARGRELGLFLHDRQLLACRGCGLMEDVLVTGLLVTCREDSLGVDTGLRFVEHRDRDDLFVCPACGAEVVPDNDELRRT